MTKLKLIPILIFVALFSYLLALPSASSLAPTSETQEKLAAMPDFDYLSQGKLMWKDSKHNQALALFSIASGISPSSKSALNATKTALAELKAQPSALNNLKQIGHSSQVNHNSWDNQQAQSLVEFFNEANIKKLSKELLFDSNNFNKFLVALNKVDNIVEVIPKSKQAFELLKVAESTKILTDELKNEITDAINAYNKSQEINPALLEEVLNKTTPVLQLMKSCKNWADFSALLSQVKSSRHLSILLNLADPGTQPAPQLTQLAQLITAANENAELKMSILGYVNDNGSVGLQNLYKAIQKGPVGIQTLIRNPSVKISPLNTKTITTNDPVKIWWIKMIKSEALAMEAVRYVLMSLAICAIILFGVQPQHLSRVLLVKDPENANVSKITGQLFLVIFAIFAISFIFNTILGGDAAPATTTGPSQGQMSAATMQPQENVLTGMSILSLVIIVFMQFTVYAKAISELKKIKELTGTAKLKLQQLKHADIFFDLPIYLGLLGTVSSFVIMLFDPGASRIVAYTSTIIGIIFSASLRIFYVYPFQKDLTNETENSSEPVVS